MTRSNIDSKRMMLIIEPAKDKEDSLVIGSTSLSHLIEARIETAANSVFIKLRLEVKPSTMNDYFAVVVN